jgi:hypothetical protein
MENQTVGWFGDHHWRNCRLAGRAVHEEPDGTSDECRARQRGSRHRELALQPAGYHFRRLARLSDCWLHRGLHLMALGRAI